MEPAGILAPLLPSACALVLAGLALRQRSRIASLRARIDDANRTDPLTGLINRRAFEEQLGLELERATRAGRPMSVVVGDIDGFRSVNEHHGHAAGDAALQSVAQNALKWKRRIDVAARIGGEEFALLLPMTTLEAATTVAEKLRCVIEAAAFRHHGEPVQVTVSAGLTDFRPGDTMTTVYERADGALYQAKQQGRNHCVVR
jgi:diguanylate cyclase (GGDEF)-like protein